MKSMMSKQYVAIIALAGGISAASLPAFAGTQWPVPATEHQAEVLKRVPDRIDEAFVSSKPKAAGTQETLHGKRPPATEHQEEVLAGFGDRSTS